MMKDWKKYLLGYCLIAVLVLPVQAQILQIGSGTSLENYAASELQRYYYQLSGKLLNIERTASTNLKSDFILTTLDNPLVDDWQKKGILKLKREAGRTRVYTSNSKECRSSYFIDCRNRSLRVTLWSIWLTRGSFGSAFLYEW